MEELQALALSPLELDLALNQLILDNYRVPVTIQALDYLRQVHPSRAPALLTKEYLLIALGVAMVLSVVEL